MTDMYKLMLFNLLICASLVGNAEASFNGKYTKKKGNCSEKYRVTITMKAFNQYEDMCRITKYENRLDEYRHEPIAYLDLKCSMEGEEYYQQVWLTRDIKKGIVEAFYPKESPARTVNLYECR